MSAKKMNMFVMRKILTGRGVLLALIAVVVAGEVCAEELVVDRSGASITGATAEYTGMTLHGDYTIGAGAAVTNLASSGGTLLDIGPDDGDNVTMTVTGGGQFVGSGVSQKSANAIAIGRNGGKGKIVVQDVANPSDAKRNKSGYYNNNYTFGAMQWNLMLAAGASTASDTMDIVQIDTNAFFSIRCVSNLNASVKARILFNGGTYYMHNRMASPLFFPIPGSEIILEGINGNDVNIMRMDGGTYGLTGYGSGSAPTGYLRFRGSGNVILNGTGAGTSPSLRSGLTLTERCAFEQSGDLIAKGHMLLKLGNINTLPYGAETGNVVLQDAEATLDLSGRTAHVNGLLGCGSVSNGSTTATATLNISNATDKLCSEMISKDLTWLDSAMGITCVKTGAGMLLADSMPSVPVFTIEEGGVQTTAAATPETMKGETVEFKEGTSLSVAAGMYTAKNTILPKTVPVSIAAGGIYRAQDGDSTLYSPTVDAGGIVEKTGDGTLRIYDADAAFAGTIRAHGGTVKPVGLGDTNDFWRLTIMQSSRSSKENNQFLNQLAGIDLYDATGALAYTKNKMKQTDFGKAAQNLGYGEITVPAGTEVYGGAGNDNDLKYLFDNARWSHITCSNVVAKLGDESSWFPITFRLSEGHSAVMAFKLVNGWGGPETTPQAWRLESSPDGINWQVRSERLGGADISYDSDGLIVNDPYAGFADNVSVGLASTAVLRADTGATIDLGSVAEGAAPCGGIEFDCAQGGGTITRFEPAANGVLTISNWPAGSKIGGYELPLTFGSVVGASNLSTWRLVINGEQKSNRIAFKGGKIHILQEGFTLIIR